MRIKGVTFTGADTVDELILADISMQYPFVEWGILLSPERYGTEKYPKLEWIQKLNRYKEPNSASNETFKHVKVAAHLCGAYARQIISAEGIPDEIFYSIDNFERWQINANFTKNPPSPSYLWMDNSKYILQYNKNNSQWIEDALRLEHPKFRPANLLYDSSGGRGIAPKEWLPPIPTVNMGYSGGINPGNIRDVCMALTMMRSDAEVWLDMEAGIRDRYGRFDFSKIGYVIAVVEHFMGMGEIYSKTK